MIQANEYRVGNRFIRELHIHNRGLDYDKDFVLDEDNMGKLFGMDNSLSSQDLFPIPITVEILSRCGFKWNGATHSKPTNCVVSEDLKTFSIYLERYEDDIDFDCPKSLHQLQNLYFALCGTELEINL